MVGPILVPTIIQGDFRQALGAAVLLTLFGLPMAVVATFVVGLPIASIGLKRGWTGYLAALVLGGLTGALIGVGLLGWQLLTSSGSWGGSEGMAWVDGWPTKLGWAYEIRNLVWFALDGCVAGLTARRIAFK
jgi:hypothetical protein